MLVNIGTLIARSPSTLARGAVLSLSANSVAEDASTGTTIGTLSVINGSGSYTYSITADPSSKFSITGSSLKTAAALDYETATSHSVTISASNGVDTPTVRTFSIQITNVLEVTLSALTLSASSLTENTVEGTVVGAIQNKSSGSTLTLTDSAGSRFKISGTNIVAGSVSTDYETATSHQITIRETHADASNSPRDTTLTITILDDVSDNPVGPGDDPPTVVAFSPADNATGLSVGSITTLSITFSEPIKFGTTVSIKLFNAADTLIQEWTQDDVLILAIDGDQLEMSLNAPLDYAQSYYVKVTTDSVEDLAGNAFAGISNTTTWNFSTAAAVPSAFSAGDWSVAAGDTTASVTISSLPAANGASITSVQYRLDGGSWVSSGGTGNFTITGLTNAHQYDIEVRAVNSVGAGATSDTKQVTPGAAAYVGPGDLETGWPTWVGLRAFSDADIGTPAVRVSNDGGTTQIDLVTVAGGGLDLATLASFGAGGVDVKIVTWYNKGSSGNHFTQSNDAARALLILDGSGKPTAVFSGTQRYNATKLPSAISQPYMISAVARRTSLFTSQLAIFYANDGGGDLEFAGANDTIVIYAGSNATAAGATNDTDIAINALFNGASSVLNVLGTETTVSPGTNAAGGGGVQMLGEGGGGFLRGRIKECGLLNKSGNRAAVNSNQRSFWSI